jgi:hypothetical protein
MIFAIDEGNKKENSLRVENRHKKVLTNATNDNPKITAKTEKDDDNEPTLAVLESPSNSFLSSN